MLLYEYSRIQTVGFSVLDLFMNLLFFPSGVISSKFITHLVMKFST